MNREAILTALFALVSASASFKTASRRLKHVDDVPASAQPALFQTEDSEEYVRDSEAVPQKVTLNVELWVYASAGLDPNVIPATTLNNLLDAIDTALAPSPVTGLQTLGGLVAHCWIDSKVDKDPGDLNGQAIARIPVKILVP